MVLFRVNPLEASIAGFLMFYLSLLFASLGSLALLGLLVRRIFKKGELAYRHVVISFRQAVFFSILIVGLLFLQSFRLLTWWNMVLLIFALTVLEFFFISYKRAV